MAQWNLLTLKRYEGLVSEDDSIHSIHSVNQISDISKSSGHFSQSGNVNHTLLPGQDGQPNPTCPQYPDDQHQNCTNAQHHILELAMCMEYLAS